MSAGEMERLFNNLKPENDLEIRDRTILEFPLFPLPPEADE
ncbi:unnamed protein product [marine sediment metagenome]|uniref:Uncharacterized protein n=1 Tax=marine sediment metagenome TaxID=412755 RepID=X1SFI1_9ZZZZ